MNIISERVLLDSDAITEITSLQRDVFTDNVISNFEKSSICNLRGVIDLTLSWP